MPYALCTSEHVTEKGYKWWVNIKIEQFAIARNAFQGHTLPIWDLSITPTDKQEYLNDPN